MGDSPDRLMISVRMSVGCVSGGVNEPQLDDGDDDAMRVLFSATTNFGLVVETCPYADPRDSG